MKPAAANPRRHRGLVAAAWNGFYMLEIERVNTDRTGPTRTSIFLGRIFHSRDEPTALKE
jgi:hypothetical protein